MMPVLECCLRTWQGRTGLLLANATLVVPRNQLATGQSSAASGRRYVATILLHVCNIATAILPLNPGLPCSLTRALVIARGI